MKEDEIIFRSIPDLGKLLRTKQISPTELTEIFLQRLESLGPHYNAVVTVTRERALRQARQAEEELAAGRDRGPLHGIPYGAKDLLATSEGIPTTWGAAPFRNQVFDYDATVIRKLEAAGAILVAKLAMIELAGGMGYRQPNASFTGPCRNPWNPQTWSGGSSSGSGAAVAAGLVPFALGSETWGSIISPAAYCGVAGLRPTYGRVSRYGAMALCWTLDKVGPLCLTADDCGLVLQAIAGPDPLDPSTLHLSYQYDRRDSSRRFRLGIIPDALDGVEEEVRENFHQSLRVLEAFATIEEVALPDFPYEAVTRTILNAEAASAFDDFIASGKVSELTAPEDRYGGYARTTVLAKDYLRALRIRGLLAKEIDKLLSSYDALVAPARPNVAPPLDKEFRSISAGTSRDVIGAMGNGAGLPGISIPNGFSKEGLPTGLLFVGRSFAENTLLAIARTYQGATSWHTRHPPELKTENR